jgi:hypothetical protein
VWERDWCENWFRYILDHPEKPWDWYWISQNPNITWDIITTNPEKPWDWDTISQNPNITWDIIRTNPEKPWDWHAISRNPNMTWDIIQAHPEKPWNWYWISFNSMTKAKQEFLHQKRQAHYHPIVENLSVKHSIPKDVMMEILPFV